ncbi:fibronectin type III domain-containing protein [Xanthomarina sp. F1114]|uniref:fibronectin type III domain-containing protein n=1 Tax=Xanthomarina sp. F1114 TaxID=2996019 RepID=UPI00225E5BFB|nr:fibronectin type III domain-containing protein [Xanthomarina sp. F1114]MCX7547430.1 fibronectin type III domain-containing protein [Xanthomarina sp. F1114]
MKKITLLFAFLFAITQANFSQVQVGVSTNTTNNLPVYSCYGYSYSQQIFLASEINASGDITSISFYLDDITATSTSESTAWTIYMGHSSKSEYASTTDWEDLTNMTQAYSGTVSFPAVGNWLNLTLDTPFTYNGTDNLIVGVHENEPGYNCSIYWQSTDTSSNMTLVAYSDSSDPDPTSPTEGSFRGYRSNIVFGGITQACPFPTDLAATAITTSQAELSWTENGSASLYNVEIVPAGTPPSGVATDSGVGNPYIKTGLASGTDFEYYVQADCGGGELSSWNGPIAFTTLCENVTAYPYLESFEGITSGQPACWSVQGTTTIESYHFTSYETGFSGRGMRFNSYFNSSGLTSELITPTFDASALPSLQLKFYYKNPTGGNFEVLVSSDGGATYTSIANGLTDQAEWTPVSYDISSNISNNVLVKFVGTSNYGGGDAYIYLDEVQVREVPSCVEPSNLVVSNITPNSADFGWTPGGSETTWDIELVDITAGGSVTGNATSTDVANPYTQTGLTAANDYQFYVRSNCGGGELSTWSGPYNFATSCDLVTEFSENFDGVTSPELPNCWEKVGTTGSVNTQTTSANTAPNTLYLYSNSATNMAVVAMQPVSNLGDGSHWLRFNLRGNFSSNGVVEFGYLVNPIDADSFVAIESITASSLTYTEHTVVPPAGTYSNYPAFRHTGSPANSLLIDDVVWEATPTCLAPSALSVSNVTTNSADLNWNPGGSETLWDIEFIDITAGETATGNPTVTDVSNPYSQSGLVAANNYAFYVRANCGSGDYSSWTGPFNFITTCDAVNVPYTVDFQESTATPDCTSIINEGAGSTQWEVVSVTSYGFTPNHLRYKWDTSNAANSWFFTRGVNLTGGETYTITYDYGGTGTTFPEALKVAYGTDRDSASMTNIIADYPSVVNSAPMSESQNFTPATTGVYYIGFQAYSDANQFYLHLDNISIDEALSIEESELLSFKYYPNPVDNILNLRSVQTIQSVEVFNLLGQEVLRTASNSANMDVDMSNLQSGTYFVKVTIENATKTIKVIKK